MGEMLRGQAKALNQQKTNSNISNVISSDQVGRFPDANIGDALKRVPGITSSISVNMMYSEYVEVYLQHWIIE